MRGERDGQTLVEAAEEVVRGLRGVQAVRVEGDGEGGIRLVHVLGGPDRSAKVIAVDVISAIAAALGVELEPRQVRVAPQRRADGAPPPDQLRLKYAGFSVAVLRSAAEVKVQLEEQGLRYEGIAAGPNARGNRLELVGQATLSAVELFLRTEGMFFLEGVGTLAVGPQEVAVAVVSLPGREDETLSGSAVVRDDPREAVVRAVLDAINRPVSWLVGRRTP